jgi:hypothetical protein
MEYGNFDDSNNEVSIRWLVTSLARGFVEGLRRNKLAALLAVVTLVVLVGLALDKRFDGLSHYQEAILPQLMRLEIGFHNRVRAAENTSGDWRRYYFENAHRQVRDILRAARLARPEAHFSRKKHREFIRYYELLDSEFNTVETQMLSQPDMDYVQQLKDRMSKLKPIRDSWAQWAHPGKLEL